MMLWLQSRLWIAIENHGYFCVLSLLLKLLFLCRYSAGKEASMLRDLKPSDFDPREKFWTRFPPEGSKITPPHQSAEFRWKDYCPVVFRYSLYFHFLMIHVLV